MGEWAVYESLEGAACHRGIERDPLCQGRCVGQVCTVLSAPKNPKTLSRAGPAGSQRRGTKRKLDECARGTATLPCRLAAPGGVQASLVNRHLWLPAGRASGRAGAVLESRPSPLLGEWVACTRKCSHARTQRTHARTHALRHAHKQFECRGLGSGLQLYMGSGDRSFLQHRRGSRKRVGKRRKAGARRPASAGAAAAGLMCEHASGAIVVSHTALEHGAVPARCG